MPKCPGQDQRFWKPDDIFEVNCPYCQTPTEIWKDEPKVKCPNCHNQVINPKLDFGCAEWCKYSKQCLGALGEHDSSILCYNLIKNMKKIFADAQTQIDHSLETLKYAERIHLAEGGEPLVVKAAAILHDISQEKNQQTEAVTTAKEILMKYEINTELIEHICRIIANLHSADDDDIDTIEFKIVQDANRLAELSHESSDTTKEQIKNLVDSTFKTAKGRQIATEQFVDTQKPQH